MLLKNCTEFALFISDRFLYSNLILTYTKGNHVEYHPFLQPELPVVVLADLTHSHQGLEVLIRLVRVDVVKRTAVTWVAVRGSKINRHLQTHTQPPSAKVLSTD